MADDVDGKDVMTRKKDTFLLHVTVFVGISIGFDNLEELQNYLKGMHSLRLGVERIFNPKGHMNFVRQKILTKVAITHEVNYDEDVIRNCVTTGNGILMKLE